MLIGPDQELGRQSNFWHHGSSCYMTQYLCSKFHLPSMIRSVSRTLVLEVFNWRTLIVPDQILVGWGHLWCHGSPWYVILELCTKFQLSSMIRSVSGTPIHEVHTWRTFEGSGPDTWKTGSTLTSWILILYNSVLCVKLQISSMIRRVPWTPVLKYLP